MKLDEYIELIKCIKQEFYKECGIPKALFDEKEEKWKNLQFLTKKVWSIQKFDLYLQTKSNQ